MVLPWVFLIFIGQYKLEKIHFKNTILSECIRTYYMHLHTELAQFIQSIFHKVLGVMHLSLTHYINKMHMVRGKFLKS